MRYNIKKPGGFPPSPPGKPKYDKDGEYTASYLSKISAYKARYKRWERDIKQWEEVFGVPFDFIDEPDYYYIRRKRLGIIKPTRISYNGNHPADKIFE